MSPQRRLPRPSPPWIRPSSHLVTTSATDPPLIGTSLTTPSVGTRTLQGIVRSPPILPEVSTLFSHCDGLGLRTSL
ncbi:hypothetical protein BHM03_00032024 [Ensete ventricosum]|nr:hypothetical protein BHM03_00032024 [Ensete ventricosum]